MKAHLLISAFVNNQTSFAEFLFLCLFEAESPVGTLKGIWNSCCLGAKLALHNLKVFNPQTISGVNFMKRQAITISLVSGIALFLGGCDHKEHEVEHAHATHHKVFATTPKLLDVTITQQYVCQIHSQRHIKICALESGYLEEIPIREGQLVKRGDLLFKILPTLYQAKLDAELAEVQLATLEYNNTNRLFMDKVVSQNEVALHQAKLAKAQAKAKLAEAELNFTTVRAPFDGIVDRLHEQQGSLIKEGDVLTTLSDNSVMWVYFNVPEARYLEYMTELGKNRSIDQVELVLANGKKYHHAGRIGAIEAKFNNETGNIPFRADFPNPERLLRHGQTGNILIHKPLKDAMVIPQRATFETLDKRYVYVIDSENKIHQREVAILHELEDIFVIKAGLTTTDKIVLEGVQQVHEGEKVDFELRKADQVLANQKNHAE